MAQQIIVDTDILIDFSLDRPDAIQTIGSLEQEYEIGISVIIAMELYAGCRSKEDLKKVDDLLSDFTIHHVTKPVSEKAYEWMKKFRSSHGVEINDMIIVTTALTAKSTLISKNQKHYKFLPDIQLLEYQDLPMMFGCPSGPTVWRATWCIACIHWRLH